MPWQPQGSEQRHLHESSGEDTTRTDKKQAGDVQYAGPGMTAQFATS